MGYEFEEGSLKKYSGAKFFEISIEEKLTSDKLDDFDKDFPKLLKFKRPGQWD